MTMVMGELEQETELLVIGSGPGGYAAAFRAADLPFVYVALPCSEPAAVLSLAAGLPLRGHSLR